MKIGSVNLDNNIFLAPMAGITDLPFRILCGEMGAGLVCTEMVSAKGLYYNNSNTEKLLEAGTGGAPLAVQLFGSEPEIMAESAERLCSDAALKFGIIDINMGCPAAKIVKNGEGSALMRNPALAGRIIKAVSSAADRPVTVKIRKGFNSGNANAAEIAKIAEDNGAAAVTVHGRTRKQFYSGTADWDIIGKVRQAVKIPVIGNGDVNSPESAERMLRETGCDAVMVGRAAQGNPWIFKRILYRLKTGETLPEPELDEKKAMTLRHAGMLADFKGERVAVPEMRKHLCWYLKGIKNAAETKVKVNAAKSLDEIKEIIYTCI